jgi:hypothetical protein
MARDRAGCPDAFEVAAAVAIRRVHDASHAWGGPLPRVQHSAAAACRASARAAAGLRRAPPAGDSVLQGRRAVARARHRDSPGPFVEHAGGDGRRQNETVKGGRRSHSTRRHQERHQDLHPGAARRSHWPGRLLRQPIRRQPADLRSRLPAAIRRLDRRSDPPERGADRDWRWAGAL